MLTECWRRLVSKGIDRIKMRRVIYTFMGIFSISSFSLFLIHRPAHIIAEEILEEEIRDF